MFDYVKSIVSTYGKELLAGREGGNEFRGLTKQQALQETKAFSETQINVLKCKGALGNLLYLFLKGERFSTEETTSLFFAITRLLQSQDTLLRKMTYLLIKEMRPEAALYVVTNCVSKDLQSDRFRNEALRTAHLTLDVSSLSQLERYIKMSILDRSPEVARNALLCGIHLAGPHEELVRKWAGEVQESLAREDCSFHALVLLYVLRRKDLTLLLKALSSAQKLSPAGHVQLLRVVRAVSQRDSLEAPAIEELGKLIVARLRHPSHAVCLEAVKTTCEFPYFGNKEVHEAVGVLYRLLGHSSQVVKYAALRQLNEVLEKQSRRSLIKMNSELEKMLNHDSNKCIADLAVSVMLKICKEADVERLLIKVFSSKDDASVESIRDHVRSVSQLLQVFPAKAEAIFFFLEGVSKSNIGKDPLVKKELAEAYMEAYRQLNDYQPLLFRTLAELVEDNTADDLQIAVLNFFADQFKAGDDHSFLQTVIVKLQLESDKVRACTLSALQKISRRLTGAPADALTQYMRICAEDPSPEVIERYNCPVEEVAPLPQDRLD
jgi:coatomer protein complex subunit gamma